MQIQFIINQSSVYKEVAKTTSYTGAKIQGDDNAYSRILTTDEDSEMLNRFFDESRTEAAQCLIGLVSNETFVDGVYTLTLNVSKSFDTALQPSMQLSLFSFFVQNIISKWYVFTNKEGVQDYASKAVALIEDVREKSYHKKKPTRPVLSDEEVPAEDTNITIKFDDLTDEQKALLKGEQGAKGDKGNDGVSITSVTPVSVSVASGGTSVYRITLSNGSTFDFNVKNGINGSNGTNGVNGTNGTNGHSPVITTSKTGTTTTIYIDGIAKATINDGVNGTNGTNGTDGSNGVDGHSPVVTATKANGVTTIFIDGVSIGTINDGTNGSNYVLTDADKTAIAALINTNIYTKSEIDSKLDVYHSIKPDVYVDERRADGMVIEVDVNTYKSDDSIVESEQSIVTIPLADEEFAGLMTPSEKSKVGQIDELSLQVGNSASPATLKEETVTMSNTGVPKEIVCSINSGDKILISFSPSAERFLYNVAARPTLGSTEGSVNILSKVASATSKEWTATTNVQAIAITAVSSVEGTSGSVSIAVVIKKVNEASGMRKEIDECKASLEELEDEVETNKTEIEENVGKPQSYQEIATAAYTITSRYSQKEIVCAHTKDDIIVFDVVTNGKYKYYISERTTAGVANVGVSKIVKDITESGRYVWTATANGGSFILNSGEYNDSSLGADNITISIKKKTNASGLFKDVEELQTIDVKTTKILESQINSNPSTESSETLVDGESIALDGFPRSNKKGDVYQFFANITTFGSIRIERGYNASKANWIVIDDTNVLIYVNNNSTPTSVAHGLTFAKQIYVNCFVDNDGAMTINVHTIGGSFTHKFTNWTNEAHGLLKVTSIGSSLADCELKATNVDFAKPIWWFGASYENMSNVSGAMKSLGYFDYYLCAKEGKTTTELKEDFYRALNFATPKYLIASFANTSDVELYMSNMAEVYNKCKDLGIEFIAKIQPSSEKSSGLESRNERIKALGCRVIDSVKALRDFSKAESYQVGSYDDGTPKYNNNWYEGYLGGDGQHPTTKGSMAIAMQTLVDVPELMQLARSK